MTARIIFPSAIVNWLLGGVDKLKQKFQLFLSENALGRVRKMLYEEINAEFV